MNELDGLIGYIWQHEARGDLNAVHSRIPAHLRPKKPLTSMTVGEVYDWQKSIDPFVKSEAAGALQIMPETLADELEKGSVRRDDIFDEATQRTLTISLMGRRGLKSFMSGGMSAEDFGTNLAKEWASLPVMKDTYNKGKFVPRGNGYYGGDGMNPSRVAAGTEEFGAVLADPGHYDPSKYPATKGMAPATEPAGTSYSSNAGARFRAQNESLPDLSAYSYPWRADPVSLRSRNMAGLPGSGGIVSRDPMNDVMPLPAADYATRTGPGGGPIDEPGAIRSIIDNMSDGFIARKVARTFEGSYYEYDDRFDPVDQALRDGYRGRDVLYLADSKNAQHYQAMRGNLQGERDLSKRMQVYDGWIAPLVGGALNPDSIAMMAVPGGVVASGFRSGAMNVGKSALRAMLYSTPAEIALEAGRAGLDPNSSAADSFVRVAGGVAAAGFFSGVLSGALTPSARRALAENVARDAAKMRGVGLVSDTFEVRPGFKTKVNFVGRFRGAVPEDAAQSGILIRNGRIHVSEARLMERFAEHHRTGDSLFANPNEFMEYEIARHVSLAKSRGEKFRAFATDEAGAAGSSEKPLRDAIKFDAETGEIAVDKAAIKKALDEDRPIELGAAPGTPAAQRIRPIPFMAAAFKDADHAAKMVMKAHDLAATARDDNEFGNSLQALFLRDGHLSKNAAENMTPEHLAKAAAAEKEADAAAAAHLEGWRKKNNRILEDAKMEALSRLSDSPYKRVHRNSLAGETRDLVDKLAADGAFLRGTDSAGETVGPSVYSRAKTWDGVVRALWDREREIYGKYLGFPNAERIADVGLNDLRRKRADGTRAIPMEEWRDRVSKAYITKQRDEIPEVNEMVEHLRGAWAEWRAATERFGVISSQDNLAKRADALRERMADLDPEGETAKLFQQQLDMVEQRQRMAKTEPSEDYFTRIYSKQAIRENRDAFKDLVMNWMRQNPWVDVWELGADDLGRELSALKAQGVDINQPRYEKLRTDYAKAMREGQDKSEWRRVNTSSDLAHLSDRADQMIEQILGEAEPEDLATARAAHRPTFGRHRQFNIPNALLLKDGPEGNRAADFIETDYLLVQKIYAERMGPAVEMARTFARPLDGVNWEEGFEQALENVKAAEEHHFGLSGQKGSFEDHWAPIERDMRHLLDRVTNRVIKSPERWDNRSATVLRSWAQLAFMGLSALPAVQELGALAMRHGAGKVWRSAFLELDDATKVAFRANVDEMRAAGAIMEVVQGMSLSRFAETGMDAVGQTAPERWLRHASNKYFLLNGLAPISTRLKEMDAVLRVHETVRRISDVGDGVASEADLSELARFGISKADAAKMAKEPIFMTEEGHWQANTNAWADQDLVLKFRAAIAQGNENTILMATAADKPIIMDGTVYLRKGARVDRYARKAGLEDAGDYWRMQSGLLTLPFTFWNYGTAAFNKILVAGLDEPSSQKLGGVAAMIGLGWLVSQVRTPAHEWDRLGFDDKMARAVEQSGVLGLLTQAGGVGATAIQGATGANIRPFDMGGQRNPSMLDAATRVAGAGPSVARNAVQGAMTGDATRFSWSLPWRNHFAFKWLFDAAVDGIERRN